MLKRFSWSSLKIAAVLMALTLALVVPAVASADQRDFTLTNSSGFVVDQLFVGPNDVVEWGDDILGADVLPSGVSAAVVFGRFNAGACLYDIKVVFEDGSSLESLGFDLCSISLIELGPDGVFYYS